MRCEVLDILDTLYYDRSMVNEFPNNLCVCGGGGVGITDVSIGKGTALLVFCNIFFNI